MISSVAALEVLAHFHDGPLGEPGVTRVLPPGQLEYVFIDDLSQQTGTYWLSLCDEPGTCYEWMGWRQ